MHGKPYTRFIENLCLSPHRKVSGGRLLSGNQFFRLTARIVAGSEIERAVWS